MRTCIGSTRLAAGVLLLSSCGGGSGQQISRSALADGASSEQSHAAIHDAQQLGVQLADDAYADFAMSMLDPDKGVRMEAVEALTQFPDRQAFDLLSQALVDPEVEVREAAVEAFADLGNDEAANALSSALTDSSVSVREEAVEALGRIGGPVAISALLQALADPDATVQETAREWLARLDPS